MLADYTQNSLKEQQKLEFSLERICFGRWI